MIPDSQHLGAALQLLLRRKNKMLRLRKLNRAKFLRLGGEETLSILVDAEAGALKRLTRINELAAPPSGRNLWLDNPPPKPALA